MTIKKYWWLALLRGIVLTILAIYIFQHPLSALVGIAIYISISLLFTGISQIIVSLASKDTVEDWGWGLAGGIVDIIFAIVLLSNPGISAASLPFAVGFWLIFSGAMIFVNSFRSKKEGSSSWGMEMFSGVLSVLAGYMISSDLFVGTFAITSWIGFGFLMAGIANIIMAFRLKKT